MSTRIYRLAAVLAVGAIALGMLAGCARSHDDATSDAARDTARPSATPSTAGPSVGVAADGTAIPGGKPTWLDELPDPSGVDRTDPEAVMRAYVITAFTWDTRVDATSAYATQRAAIYLTAALRQAAADYDPDAAKGQAEFTQAAQHDAYTTVSVRSVVEEGLDPDTDGDVRRIVHFLVTTTPRDGTSTATVAEDAWVTVTQENGQWAITAMQTQLTQN